MSNEEFDNLKEELMWEGSSVVMLSADERRFLEASMAYVSGSPIMSDEEFDKLKQQLKIDGSDIVVEGPRCSLRSRKVYSDLNVDYLKMFLLNVPVAVVALGLYHLRRLDHSRFRLRCPHPRLQAITEEGITLYTPYRNSIPSPASPSNTAFSFAGNENLRCLALALKRMPMGKQAVCR